MPTVVSVLLADIYQAIGRSDMTTAQPLALRGINFGQVVASALFSPPEMKTSGSLTVTSSATSTSLSGLTRMLELDHLYNVTAVGPIFLLPMDLFIKTVDYTLTGNHVKFAAIYGQTLYVRPYPAVENTLTAYYKIYPDRITTTGASLAFSGYDDFILNCALQFVWAGLEETEQSGAIDALIQKMGAAHNFNANQRALLQKEAFSGVNVQGAQAQG